MRNFISSILVAAAVALVLDAVVLPAGFSLAVTAKHSMDTDLSGQVVNRTRKGDRLQVPLANRSISPPSTILVGANLRSAHSRPARTRILPGVACPDLSTKSTH